MSKIRATTYTFTAAAKTIDCAAFTSLEAIQLITNVTDNVIIYNFADPTKGGTLASTTLTLTYDTTSMSDTDKLMILVDDGGTPATSTIQTNGTQKTQLVDSTGAELDLWHTGDTFTAAADHGLEILGVSNETPNKYRPIKVDGTGNLQIGGDVAAAATDSGNPVKVGGKYNATLPTFTDGQRGDIQIDPKGQVRTILGQLNSTNTNVFVADNADAVTTSATQRNLLVHPKNMVFNGTTWDRQLGNSTDGTLVNLGANNDVVAAGDVASGAADSGNPVKVGGKYSATPPTLADGQRGDLQVNNRGVLYSQIISAAATANANLADNADAVAVVSTANKLGFVNRNTVFNGTNWDRMPGNTAGVYVITKPSANDVTLNTAYARKYYTNAGAVTDGIIWSPAAGTRWHVVTMYIQVSAAATVTLEDDKAAGDDPVWKGELAANSGVVLNFTDQYPMASGEDAADLTITTTAGNCYVTCVGFEA